jgi:hypothetical protein
MGKEKVRGFQEEGLRNQEVHRSGVSRNGLLPELPKLILTFLVVLGILGLFVR